MPSETRPLMDDELNQAYLLSWDGATWRDVVRLRAGQVVTVGSSATNKLVLHDDVDYLLCLNPVCLA